MYCYHRIGFSYIENTGLALTKAWLGRLTTDLINECKVTAVMGMQRAGSWRIGVAKWQAVRNGFRGEVRIDWKRREGRYAQETGGVANANTQERTGCV